MKRNCKKNLDGRIRQLVSLALRVNRETKHHVFVTYYGHTQHIDIYAFRDGWREGNQQSFINDFYIDDRRDLFAKISECRANLKSLLPAATTHRKGR